MTDPQNPESVNGWTPPKIGANRLPPYAPRVAGSSADAASGPGSTPEAVSDPAAVSNPAVSDPVSANTPAVEQPAPADPFGAEPPTEWIPLPTVEPEQVLPAMAALREETAAPAAPADSGRIPPEDGDPLLLAAGEPEPRRKPGSDPIRTFARGLGQTLITLGVVVLLFVVYEVYVTDIFGAQKQAEATEKLEIKWAEAHESTAAPGTVVVTAPPAPAEQEVDPAERTASYDLTLGDAFAKIFIPAFGADYQYSVVEGTDPDDLYVGPGHYEDSQLPGELGNFAVAGHRVSKGSPFNDLDELRSCDAIIVETQDDWFVYRVLPMDTEVATWDPSARPECADVEVLGGSYSGVVGREITLPSDIAQVYPIPHRSAFGADGLAAATERLITLTTCHPQFSDAERMIVHGVLVKSYAKAEGFVPPELQEG